MKKLTLFLMSQKGFEALEHFIALFGAGPISFVVGSTDPNIQKDYYKEIRELCKKHSIQFIDRKEKFSIDTAYTIAISWRWLIPLGQSKLIVMHDSLLPKYRGFAPLVNCLVNGEKKIGVTALFASEEYDKGDIIAQQSANITYPVKISEAIDIAAGCYKKLIEKVGKKIISGKSLQAKKQSESEASYSLWLNEDDYDINWNKPAKDIKRFIDAVGFPYNGAATYMDGKKLRVLDAEVIPDLAIENRKAGKVIFMQQDKPVIVCGKGLLKILSLTEDGSTQEILPLKRFRVRFT